MSTPGDDARGNTAGEPPAPSFRPVGYREPRVPGSAVWALVLGVLAIFCFSILTGIPAIIVGRRALKTVRTGALPGAGIARTGLILGIISIPLLAAEVILYWQGIVRPRFDLG